MADTHTFEHDGHTVECFPATVRTDLAFFRYMAALLAYFGYADGNEMSERDPEEWENVKDYAAHMAQCKTTAPWYVGSMMGAVKTGEAYTLYMEQEPSLRHDFVAATNAMLPLKKTTETTLET